jgi:hypothetical protein
MKNFNEFVKTVIMESLHPELRNIIQQKDTHKNKKNLIVKKIKELSERGEPTGVEGNMPVGSSRAYIKHSDPTPIKIDGQDHFIHFGTKIAITSKLDRYHDKHEYDGMSLGQMQNYHENNDYYVQRRFRVLVPKEGEKNSFITNHEHGIFPPLLEHDTQHHNWSDVGHVDDISKKQFRNLTKTPEFPDGIKHEEFVDALIRDHNLANGKHWFRTKEEESRLNKVSEHPLFQKFVQYHRETGNNPYDYQQIKNMGIWTHPNGKQFIVARDHGFANEVAEAYRNANIKKRKNTQGYFG